MPPTGPSGHVRRGALISKQCARPLDGVSAATENAMRGRRCLSVGPASTVSLCLRRKSGDRRSVKREGGPCVLCDEDTKNKAKGDGVRAAMHMARRFWALPSSQCPGCPRVNSANIHLGTQRATLALLTFGQDPRMSSHRQESRFKTSARLANAHHKTPRGGAVSGAG